jgi:rhodanese-related sulfurtransferase
MPNDPRRRLQVVVAVLALTVGATGHGLISAAAESAGTQAEAVGFATLDVGRLAAMLQDKGFTLVNVHIPYEGEIEGTDANIPFDRIADNLDRLPADKSAEIVLYCRSGRMSEIAAGTLSRLGYDNVAHVAGGMVDWQKSGRAIVGE